MSMLLLLMLFLKDLKQKILLFRQKLLIAFQHA